MTAADGSRIQCGGCKGTGRVHPPVAYLSPRDTWPDLRVTFHLFPWSWRLRPRLYRDEDWMLLTTVEWLFLKIEWWANRPMFSERAAASGETT